MGVCGDDASGGLVGCKTDFELFFFLRVLQPGF